MVTTQPDEVGDPEAGHRVGELTEPVLTERVAVVGGEAERPLLESEVA